MSGRALIAVAVAAALLLAAGYAALGGGRSEPAETADPCEPRPSPKPKTTEKLAEQLALATLDGVACELGVSREEVALAIASDRERAALAEDHDLDHDQVESALRAGILRAIDGARRAEVIDRTSAAALSAAARLLPLQALIDGLRDSDQLTDALDNGARLDAATLADRTAVVTPVHKVPVAACDRELARPGVLSGGSMGRDTGRRAPCSVVLRLLESEMVPERSARQLLAAKAKRCGRVPCAPRRIPGIHTQYVHLEELFMSVPHALLALLSEGPKYGLRLQNEFESRTGEVWPLNIGQVYTTLHRLERDGLVEAAGGDGERSQKRYRITAAGAQELVDWLRTPPELVPPPRDELVIKVLVALQIPGIDIRELLQVHRRHVIEVMQRYTQVKAVAAENDVPLALVADAELFRLEAIVRWLDAADVRLKQLPAAPPVEENSQSLEPTRTMEVSQ